MELSAHIPAAGAAYAFAYYLLGEASSGRVCQNIKW